MSRMYIKDNKRYLEAKFDGKKIAKTVPEWARDSRCEPTYRQLCRRITEFNNGTLKKSVKDLIVEPVRVRNTLPRSKAWTLREVMILHENYHVRGPKGMGELLPGRTYLSIKGEAAKYGLKADGRERSFEGMRTAAKPKMGIQDPELRRAVCGSWR